MKYLKLLLTTVIVGALVIVVLRLTHPLPDVSGEQASAAIPANVKTQLGSALLPLVAVR